MCIMKSLKIDVEGIVDPVVWSQNLIGQSVAHPNTIGIVIRTKSEICRK